MITTFNIDTNNIFNNNINTFLLIAVVIIPLWRVSITEVAVAVLVVEENTNNVNLENEVNDIGYTSGINNNTN